MLVARTPWTGLASEKNLTEGALDATAACATKSCNESNIGPVQTSQAESCGLARAQKTVQVWSVQVLANGISSDGELRSPRLHGFVERPELANPVLLHNDLQDLSPPRAVLFLEGAQVVAILLHAEVNLVLIACQRAHGAVLGEVLREGVLCRRWALLLCLALRLALSFARLALCLDRFRVRILGLLRVWLLWLHWLHWLHRVHSLHLLHQLLDLALLPQRRIHKQ